MVGDIPRLLMITVSSSMVEIWPDLIKQLIWCLNWDLCPPGVKIETFAELVNISLFEVSRLIKKRFEIKLLWGLRNLNGMILALYHCRIRAKPWRIVKQAGWRRWYHWWPYLPARRSWQLSLSRTHWHRHSRVILLAQPMIMNESSSLLCPEVKKAHTALDQSTRSL